MLPGITRGATGGRDGRVAGPRWQCLGGSGDLAEAFITGACVVLPVVRVDEAASATVARPATGGEPGSGLIEREAEPL